MPNWEVDHADDYLVFWNNSHQYNICPLDSLFHVDIQQYNF